LKLFEAFGIFRNITSITSTVTTFLKARFTVAPEKVASG